jgi:hypothetical protein
MAAVGVRAEVHFRAVPLWADMTGRVPTLICDPGPGHVWMVFGVLDSWARNLRARGEPGVTAWWACRVDGPLPGDSSRTGRFVMSVSAYEGVDGWWIEALLPSATLRLDAARQH